jgi:putative hemolysin
MPEEERGYYQMLGGFIIAYLGRISKTGDRFDWAGLRFEVRAMAGVRVTQVLVTPLSNGQKETVPQ